MSKTKIIVITPVKNESWILDRFLTVSSIFADHIIISDQYSTDNSRDICKKYPKVCLIENKSKAFNEDGRQLQLIETARNLCPNDKRILLALDADEILAANAIDTSDWQKMLNAKEGTVLFFEKPTFLNGTETVIRYKGDGWPLGYVDDGVIHQPSKIHSSRIPTPVSAQNISLKEIKILHYGLARIDALYSKLRFYTCLECIMNTKSLNRRRISYPQQLDFSREGDYKESLNYEWIKGWEAIGIDMTTLNKSNFYWYDEEVLGFFKQYGCKKFYKEDIWYFNWSAAMLHFSGNTIPYEISSPPFLLSFFLKMQTFLYNSLLIAKRLLFKSFKR